MSRALLWPGRKLGTLIALGAGTIAACSVDTSDIRFVPDSLIDEEAGGGVDNVGGNENTSGNQSSGGVGNKSGSGSGGSSPGGSKTGGSGNGGSPSAGTNPGGGSPASGGTGGVPATGYPCPTSVRPTIAPIADFDGLTDPMETWTDASMAVTFGFYTYPMGAMLIQLGDGKLTLQSSMIDRPQGTGIWMSACLDVAAADLSRLTFDLGGSRPDGQPLMMRVALGINETKFADPAFNTGGCVPPAGQNMMYCLPAGADVMVPMMASSVTIPISSFQGGSPVATVDPKEIVSIEWAFRYMNGQPAYAATITVDNVRFQ